VLKIYCAFIRNYLSVLLLFLSSFGFAQHPDLEKKSSIERFMLPGKQPCCNTQTDTKWLGKAFANSITVGSFFLDVKKPF
jgi:hypothetical protein